MSASYFANETAVIDDGSVIGNGTKIWHFSHVMNNAIIGENCILGQNVMIAPKVRIGNGVKIQNNVSIYEGVVIEDDVFIGPSVVFTNIKIPRSFVNRKDQFLSTKIGKGASVGANATVICGNNIGDFAMIGAGAVVTKNVAAYALVVGNPAKHVGWVGENGQLLDFDANGEATCAETGERYVLLNNQIRKLT